MERRTGRPENRIPIATLPLVYYVTLDKSLNLPEPPFAKCFEIFGWEVLYEGKVIFICLMHCDPVATMELTFKIAFHSMNSSRSCSLYQTTVHLTDSLCVICSFGFTDKAMKKNHPSIGVYGNGFKSGSMRLGKDAIVFTKNGGALSVGLLSQTYLERVHAQAVIVPVIPFNQQNNILPCKARVAVQTEPSGRECRGRVSMWYRGSPRVSVS